MEERLQYLLNQYEKNNCTRAELEELFHFIRNISNLNEVKEGLHQLYKEILKNHPSFTYVDESGNLIFTDQFKGFEEYDEEQPAVVHKPNRVPLFFILIAGVVLATLLGVVIKRYSTKSTEPLVYAEEKKSFTPINKIYSEQGKQKYLLLPDSTQVWLHGSSSLEYPDSFDENRVVDLKGEAYFVVNSHKRRFVVKTKTYEMIMNTPSNSSFNIKNYDEDTDLVIAVSFGKISLQQGDRRVRNLSRGQQLTVNKNNDIFHEEDISINDMGSWRNGYVAYHNQLLENVLNDIKRIYNTEALLIRNDLKNIRISAVFDRTVGVKEALDNICRNLDVDILLDGDMWVIQ